MGRLPDRPCRDGGPLKDPVLLVGTGALACALGAKLAGAGASVVLAGSWPEALVAIRQRGLLAHENGAHWQTPASAVPVDVPPPRPLSSLALVLVKSSHTDRAAAFLTAALRPDGLALTLQNGLGNRECLLEHLGDHRVAAGATFLGATVLGPAEVRIVPGRLVSEPHPRLEALLPLLNARGLSIEVATDFAKVAWSKLAANCAVNALAALHRLPNGALLTVPSLRAELESAAREVGRVAAARGLDLGRDPALIAAEVAAATAENHGSMLQDVRRGAPTEVDAINGAVVCEGRRLGIPTPVNESLWRRIRALEGRPHQDA